MQQELEDCLSNENEPVLRKMLKQSTLVSADTPATMNAKLEKQIGRYFIASNTAFRQVESKEFNKMKLSNPASINNINFDGIIHSYGCQTHTVNLLAKDSTDSKAIPTKL